MSAEVRYTLLKYDLSIRFEEREGYFAAKTDPFAITGYGDNTEEALDHAYKAVLLLLKKYTKTPGELSTYLNKMHVKHTLTVEEKPERQRQSEGPRSTVRECTHEMQMEIPAGV